MRSLTLLIVAALIAAGCGSSTNGEQGKPAATIVSDSKSAAQSAKFVHVVGSANGASIDLSIASGQGAKGSFTQAGQPIQIVRTADTVYVQATTQFYQQHGAPAALAQQLTGRWLKASASRPDLASFVRLTDPNQLFQELLAHNGPATKGGKETVGGVETVRLTFGSRGSLDVRLSGKPYPVRLSGQHGSFTFSDWNKPVAVKAPAGAIDTSALK